MRDLLVCKTPEGRFHSIEIRRGDEIVEFFIDDKFHGQVRVEDLVETLRAIIGHLGEHGWTVRRVKTP